MEEVYFQALEQLIALAAPDDPESALQLARRGLSIDATREELHQRILRVHLGRGHHALALRQFQELQSALQAAGGVPSPAARALAAQAQKALDEVADAAPLPALARLPLPRTRFFGREAEIEAICRLLRARQQPLVTLHGGGGNGKTRLALEVARRLLLENAPPWHERIYFVSLAGLRDANLIAGAILQALNVRRAAQAESLAQLVEKLSPSPTLLVLDNLEQLGEAGALWVRQIGARVPALQCLCTSRFRLSLADDYGVAVSPLPLPALLDAAGDWEIESQAPSVQLFEDRAQRARPGFRLSRHNAAAVARLCRELESIPLAIELAAARSRTLSAGQMLERLEARFVLLAARRGKQEARELETRHQSLWAAIAWSFQLLAPDEQRCFAQLAVFRGGWTLQAAQRVLRFLPDPGQQADEAAVLRCLAQLQAHSLIDLSDELPEARFHILETLREFAAEQLDSSTRLALQARHAGYFCAQAEEIEPLLSGPHQPEWSDRLTADIDNFRAALEWSLNHEAALALRLTAALGRFWEESGTFEEGLNWLQRALDANVEPAVGEQPVQPHAARARAMGWAGQFNWYRGRFEQANDYLQQSLQIHRALNDERGAAQSLHRLCMVAVWQNDHVRALALGEEGLLMARRCGDEHLQATLLLSIDTVLRGAGRASSSRGAIEESLALFRKLGDRSGTAQALQNLGMGAYAQRQWDEARAYVHESLILLGEAERFEAASAPNPPDAPVAGAPSGAAFLPKGEPWSVARALWILGSIEREAGNAALAARHGNESLVIVRELKNLGGIRYQLEAWGQLAAAQQQAGRAARLLGAAHHLGEEIGFPLPPHERADHRRYMRLIRRALGKDGFAAAWQAGRALSLDEAIALALESPAREVAAHEPNAGA